MNNLKAKLFASKAVEHGPAEPWRVNFVNTDSLPDIKVIRTSFVLNYGFIALAIASLAWFSYQEYEIAGVAADTAAINARSASMEPADAKRRDKANRFSEYALVVDEYVKFKSAGLDVFALYTQLGELRSDDIVYENVLIDAAASDAKKRMPGKIVISGKRKGVNKQGYACIEAMYAKFVSMPYLKTLKDYTPKYVKSPVTIPDTQDQSIGFTFQLILEPK